MFFTPVTLLDIKQMPSAYSKCGSLLLYKCPNCTQLKVFQMSKIITVNTSYHNCDGVKIPNIKKPPTVPPILYVNSHKNTEYKKDFEYHFYLVKKNS